MGGRRGSGFSDDSIALPFSMLKIAAAVSVPVIVFVALAVPFLNQPIDTWEWLNLCMGQQIAATGVPSVDYPVAAEPGATVERSGQPTPLLIHPPSSAFLSAASLRLFGDGEWQARLLGVLAVVATGVILAILAQRLPQDDRRKADGVGLLAICLYLVHPATVQGALYLGFSEGTLLPLSWVLFLLAWFQTQDRPWVVRVSTLGICFAIALWAKITTSLALPLSAAIVVWGMEGFVRAVLLLTGVTTLGLLLFLGSWLIYVMHLVGLTGVSAETLWSEPFHYLMGEGRVVDISAGSVLLNVSRTFVFLGPPLVFMAAVTVARRVGQYIQDHQAKPEDLIPLLAAVVLLGYWALPGGTGAFPKYHLVILPLLAWLAAKDVPPVALRKPLLMTVFAVGVIYYVYLVGDPLKLVNHDLRIAQLMGGISFVVSRIGVTAFLYAVFPLTAWGLVRSWHHALMTAALASQMALILLQAQGGYFTKHMYGTPLVDFTRTIDLVTSATPAGSQILALPEFGYKSGRLIVAGMRRDLWNDSEGLEKIIRQGKPSAVIYGLPTHTISQLRSLVGDPRLQATLERAYNRIDIGEFTVWLRGP